MTKKKTGVENTDERNQQSETEEVHPAKENENAAKDNRIKVKINTNKKTENKKDEDVAEEAPDPVQELKEALAAAEKEKTELNDRFLRAAADFDNQKKRMDRQWADFKKYANESMARDLLSVVDNLERAINASTDTEADNCGLVEGVKLTLDEVLKILERYGVTPIKAAGEKFDPNYHQAVSTQPSDEVEENVVLEEYQRGYLMHDRLLRPSMVVVSASGKQNDKVK